MANDLPDDNVVPFDPATFIRKEAQRASMSAMSSFEDDPDKAARAQELSKATGVHPAMVYGDLDNFEAQHKASLTNNLVAKNEFLQKWINDHPLAAKVSNDDIGNLDLISDKIKSFNEFYPNGTLFGKFLQAVPEVGEVARSGIQGILDVPAQFAGMKPSPEVDELIKKYAEQHDVDPEQLAVEQRVLQGRYQRGEAIQSALFGLATVIGSPIIGSFQHFISKPLEESTGFPAQATEALTVAGLAGLGLHQHVKAVKKGEADLKTQELTDTQQAMNLMEYIKAGKEPPAGISPAYDQLKIMEAEKALKDLQELEKDAQGSNTKERSPDLYSEYIRGHGESQIAISARKIKELYGDKEPALDDNLLGWVPNIAERLELESQAGGYIEIPLADWLAKADPEVAKQLHDDGFIRPRQNSFSKSEVDVMKEMEKEEKLPSLASGADAVDAVRASLHGEPLFDLERQKKLSLERLLEGELDPGQHYFSIVDREGKDAGRISLTEKDDGKNLLVQWVGSGVGPDPGRPNIFGPRVVRDLLAQLKQEFPNAESISGVRISGAKVSEYGGGVFTKVDLRNPEPQSLEQLAFHLNVISSPISLVPPTANFAPEGFRTHKRSFVSLATFKARDALKMVTPEYTSSSIGRELSKFFGKRLEELAGDVTIRVVEDSEYKAAKPGSSAFYDAITHTVVVPTKSIDGTAGRVWTAQTLYHELAHAVTYRAVHADLDLNNKFTLLMNHADKWLTENLPQQRKLHDYAFTNVGEFLAETWSNQDLQATLSHAPLDEGIAKGLGLKEARGNTVWDGIRNLISSILERIIGRKPSPTILDAILDSSKGFEDLHGMFPELREPGVKGFVEHAQFDMSPGAEPQAPEKPIGERPVIKTPGTFGLTAEQYRRYQKKIAERMQEDHEAELSRTVKEENKKQSQEWKANELAMRQEVTQDMYNRPDIAANEWFRTGTLFGQKGKTPRLDPRFLTDEQKKALPSDYVRRGGYNPDDLAGTFGYQTGQTMVDRMVILNQAQKAQGKFGGQFIDSLIDRETARRMQEKYGDLGQNVFQEAKDRVMNETQLDIIHEDILALAEKNKAELPFDRVSVKDWVKQQFRETPMRAVDSDLFISDAGKVGKAAELYLLRDDFANALKEKQAQYIATLKAQEAIKVEKLKTQFDRNAKRYSKREVSSTDQSYTNWIHNILMRVGQEVKRTPTDLENSIQHQHFKTLADFVGDKESGLREVAVADFLLDPKWSSDFGKLTVDEFRAVHDSIKSLIHNGRDAKKLIKAGEAAELDLVLAKMHEQMREFGTRGDQSIKKTSVLRTFVAAHMQIESLVNRWDKGDPFGLFTQYITRDLIDSANRESMMEKVFSKKLRDIADNVDLDKKIENNVFMDPFSVERGEPTPIPMTRKKLRAIMQHLGNENNFDKLAKGFLYDPEMAPGENAVADFKARIMDWVHKNATKEDWDWASKQGKIFAELKEESDAMYRRVSGIEPESLELRSIETPFGKYDGWYHPLDAHPVWKGSSKSLMGPLPLEEGGYFRATTSNRYTKKRTGASYPLALDLDMTPVRMKQMIHDINFREALIQSSKVIYDKRFLNTISDFYGKEYSDLFIPWLQDIAGATGYRSSAQKTGAQVMEFFRQNMITTLIGLNIGTVFKHTPTAAINSMTEVGSLNFLKEFKSLLSMSENVGERNWTYAVNKSAELQRRSRHYQETLGGAQDRVMGELTPIEAVKKGQLPSYMSLRESAIKGGAAPVAFFDLLSAVPTWLAQYKISIREGLTEGDAVYMADRAVRRAHGSTAITSRPGIVRQSGTLGTYMASLYGFFSHIWNRQFELAWKARETAGLVKEGEYAAATKELPRLGVMLFSYVIAPAIIEELVTPLTDPEKKSWGLKAAKALAFAGSSSWVGIRDVVRAILELRDPQAGLISAPMKTITDITRDLSRGPQAFDPAHRGNMIQHSITVFGAATGLTNAPEGRAAKFIHNYAVGIDKPRGWYDWYKGLRFGTTKEHH